MHAVPRQRAGAEAEAGAAGRRRGRRLAGTTRERAYHRPVTRPAISPLDGVDRLLVDGNNLIHAVGRVRSGAAADRPLPAAALIGRLRAVIPPAVAIELVFDGAPEPGMRGTRIASGILVRHAGRRSADDLIVALVDEARATAGSARGADTILVVTDDRDLRSAVGSRGAATARSAWLVSRLGRTRLASPSAGNRRPPIGEGGAMGSPGDGDDGPGWRPGRGATAKRGNPRRAPRRGRTRQN